MNKLTDKDLREALRRREARRVKTEVPADFCDNVMQEITTKPARSPRYAYIAALAAAACIAIAVLMIWPTDGEQKYDGSALTVRRLRTPSTTPAYSQSDTVGLVAGTKENIKNMDTGSRVLPVKAVVLQAKRTDRELVEQPNTASLSDSLDFYINKIERELAQMDDSLYIEHIHRVMHADERLQRIVNNYILNELHKDAQPHQAAIINNVTTDDYEE